MKALFLVLLFLVGCGGLATITETEKGMESHYKSDDKALAQSVAVEDAKKYCEKKSQRAIFKETKVKYYGSLTEAEFQKVKKISELGSLVTDIDNVDYASPAGDIITKDCGYEATATFYCK
ncbi:MAG: hypothetical protein JNM93_01315 [Bacteriovoracaceae bacterium]|nr:hypothetical protein [Bacteriovoracaceae bacterium]